jgi:acetyl-CoA carboxylase biotin carboxylase subunit
VQKVLIANRGAIARRVVRACTEMGLASVVVFSEADADAPYLQEASEAYPLAGVAPAETYLNQAKLLEIARRSGADAVHPGYGFLAEHAGFAQAVLDQDITFIGPQPVWLAQMGDKVAARALMQQRGFPVFPGSALLTSVQAAERAAQNIGYPVIVKPTGGGGGMGMVVVEQPEQLATALAQASAIAGSAFADSGVYLERFLRQPRHIEFQILADGKGNALHLYERECSMQRRNQKLVEESPAPGIDPRLVAEVADKAAAVCAELGYDNVGTLESLFTPDRQVGFLEMNTRIQVEHGVTEAVTGFDLVQAQIRLADGAQLPAAQPSRQGYAMEVRLYAEDPRTLMPSTGRLSVFRPPRMHGLRVETGYREGQEVTPYYDAMLAKLIAQGDTREKAIGRLLVGLKAFAVVGVKTNADLLMAILQHEGFLSGEIDTGLVQRIIDDQQHRSAR